LTPEEQDLLSQVEQGLSMAVTYRNKMAACDLYEAYLLMLVVKAAVDEGATVEFRDSTDAAAPHLTLRSGPSSIFTSAQYTHARITFPGKPPLEAHVGIYVAGLSTVVHECDVAVIDAEEARNCRQNSSHPSRNKLLVGIECKYYSSNVGIDLIRSFLGLTDELKKKDRFFVSNIGGANPQKMLVKHGIAWSTTLVPGQPKETQRIQGALSTIFRDYKTL